MDRGTRRRADVADLVHDGDALHALEPEEVGEVLVDALLGEIERFVQAGEFLVESGWRRIGLGGGGEAEQEQWKMENGKWKTLTSMPNGKWQMAKSHGVARSKWENGKSEKIGQVGPIRRVRRGTTERARMQNAKWKEFMSS